MNDSASALSALVPTAPIDWVTPSRWQSWAKVFALYCLGSVVGVEDRPGQRPARIPGRTQRVGDQVGAHVLSDRPPGQAPREAVDHRRQVQVRAVGEREVGDIADVALVGRGSGEVTTQQIRHPLIGRLRDRGADPAAQPQPGDVMFAHHPDDPLVVDPLVGSSTVA